METFHILTYNSTLPDIKVIIQEHLHLLQSNPKLKEFFPKIQLFRRTVDLKILKKSYHHQHNL